MVTHIGVSKGAAHGIEGLIEALAPSRKVDSQRFELGFNMASTHTKDRPTTRKMIERAE